MRWLVAVLASLALAAAALPALAADPETGEVSAASPRVDWKGTANGYLFTASAIAQGAFPECRQPYCDDFGLQVKDSADLTVTAETGDGSGFMGVEVQKPDGTKVYSSGAQAESKTTIKIRKAPVGAYIVRTMTNKPMGTDGSYRAFAELAIAPPPPSPPAGGGPQQQPSGQGGSGGSGQPSQQPSQQTSQQTSPGGAPAGSPTISVKVGRLSARKLSRARRVSLRVRTTAPLTALRATMRAGKRAVGSARLARVQSSATVKLRLKRKKLKSGRYTVTVLGRASNGATVATTVKLKVRK